MLCFSIYVVLGAVMMAAPDPGVGDAKIGGGIMMAFGLVLLAVIGAKVLLLVMAGRSLVARKAQAPWGKGRSRDSSIEPMRA